MNCTVTAPVAASVTTTSETLALQILNKVVTASYRLEIVARKE
jgi:hypothetical protein